MRGLGREGRERDVGREVAVILRIKRGGDHEESAASDVSVASNVIVIRRWRSPDEGVAHCGVGLDLADTSTSMSHARATRDGVGGVPSGAHDHVTVHTQGARHT